jgi:hypothetical protein
MLKPGALRCLHNGLLAIARDPTGCCFFVYCAAGLTTLEVLVTSAEQAVFETQQSISRLQRLQHLRIEEIRPPSSGAGAKACYEVEDGDAIFR